MIHNLSVAAERGTLDEIPREYLTLEKLLEKDNSGCNVLHWAAIYGNLIQIPAKFLTEENLLSETSKGLTCFHHAAIQGRLRRIPKEFLTPKNLLTTNDKTSESPFQIHLGTRNIKEDTIELNPREWVPYLKGLCKLESNYFLGENQKKILDDLIKKIRVIKKVRGMPALKT